MSAGHTAFAVLGAGSWGTALAALLADNGYATALWGHDPARIADIKTTRINSRFLPDLRLPARLVVTGSLQEALAHDAIPLIAVPSHGFRPLLERIRETAPGVSRIVWATKGLEEHSHKLLHELVIEIFGNVKMAVISGPNFAGEVARKLPTATTVAANDKPFAELIVACLHNNWFRPYHSDDMIGAQLGGALKNALAIASGISDGLGFGANTRAALLTRGQAEITRLALRMGAKAETLMGLAGIGDLMLTCTDNQSRNRRMGLLLAAGHSVVNAQAEIGQVVEGIKTALAAHSLGQQQGIELPIIEQVYRVLYHDVPPATAVEALLAREPKSEMQD